MFYDIRVEIKFVRVRQSFPEDALEFIHIHVMVLDEEKQIIEISIQAAIQFAQGDTIWVGNEDLHIPKLTNADDALLIPSGQGNKSFQWDRLNMDLHFPRDLHNAFVQRVWMNIVTDEVNVNRQAWTAK